MDMKHLLKADGEQVHLADQCNSRPAGEVAVDVLTASSMTCAEHARHLVLAAADGRVLAPWVNGVVERGDEVGSGDVLLIYAAWVRSLALGQVSSISGEGDADLGGVDWLLHGLAYVEGMTTARSPASAGRWEILTSSVTKVRPLRPVLARGSRSARPVRRHAVSSRFSAPRP